MEWIIGRPETLPDALLARYPELREVRFRRGGLPPRFSGWLLGQSSVAAVTLWRTIWLGARAHLDPELLLHELRHVRQFQASRAFPVLYVWETLRRGYHSNRYEVDARAWAAHRVRGVPQSNSDSN